jgi:hypothetical protein
MEVSDFWGKSDQPPGKVPQRACTSSLGSKGGWQFKPSIAHYE